MSTEPAPDLYRLLGVHPSASFDQIKTAYRKLAFKHHPDQNDGSRASTDVFAKINAANDVLSDPAKRAAYDASRNRQTRPLRKPPQKRHPPPPRPAAETGPFGFTDDDFRTLAQHFGPNVRKVIDEDIAELRRGNSFMVWWKLYMAGVEDKALEEEERRKVAAQKYRDSMNRARARRKTKIKWPGS